MYLDPFKNGVDFEKLYNFPKFAQFLFIIVGSYYRIKNKNGNDCIPVILYVMENPVLENFFSFIRIILWNMVSNGIYIENY